MFDDRMHQTKPYEAVFTDLDVHLFREGNHFHLYEKLGSHIVTRDGTDGTAFAVWAPNAEKISVIGDFNGWDREANLLEAREDESGIWEGFIPGIGKGEIYKYFIQSRYNGYKIQKGDPYAFKWEVPPRTGSIVWELDYEWHDETWMRDRGKSNALDAPISIYEVHLGSWRRVPEEDNRPLTYREMAYYLPAYVQSLGYTHVEFLPVMEHPFYGSWGYQTLGYFAPTSRYGKPEDSMALVDELHRHGIGVILDWVPSHFPCDDYGLDYFDGTHLYEHMDRRKGFHPEWNSNIFNYGRNEVRAFLISSALFWLEKYHIDGLRVDGVASMIYLDYARRNGDWIPNQYGGHENLEAIGFLRRLNEMVYSEYPDVQTIAEESTAWPMVSRPVHMGGLGFGLKWNMGWMHDTLDYFSQDPYFRKYQHNKITFGIWYAFTENFVLSISHDEVTHGKGAMYGKMPGDEWQKYANLRLLFGFMFGHPGKKLHFMGSEFGQWREWVHEESLEWHSLDFPMHAGIQKWMKDLNHFYRSEPALYELDFSYDGFEWIDLQNWNDSLLSFVRKGKNPADLVLAVCNFTPVARYNFHVGVPRGGYWIERLNSNSQYYGGTGLGNSGGTHAVAVPAQGKDLSLPLTLPPLSVLFFKYAG